MKRQLQQTEDEGGDREGPENIPWPGAEHIKQAGAVRFFDHETEIGFEQEIDWVDRGSVGQQPEVGAAGGGGAGHPAQSEGEEESGDDNHTVLEEKGEVSRVGKGVAEVRGDQSLQGAGQSPEIREFAEQRASGEQGEPADEAGQITEVER